jgi:hypothetical protein
MKNEVIMGIRCLFGHDWGKWSNGKKVDEWSEDVFKNGFKIGEDVYITEKNQRECRVCGKKESKECEELKEKKQAEYDLNPSEQPPSEISPRVHLSQREQQKFYTEILD